MVQQAELDARSAHGSSSFVFVLVALGLDALGASVRALVSGRGGADTQGGMQGVLTAVEGLTALWAPLATAGLFYAFTSSNLPLHVAGAPFLLAAGAAALAGLLLRRFQQDER